MAPPLRNRENVSDNLITAWEQFVQSKSSTNEKTQWTEIFLNELLTAYLGRKDENFHDFLQLFCIPSLAGTLISCELLTDVHQLCQQQPGGANDDTKPLQKYLLHGRGTKCLLALNLLGTQQGISCGRELASLLVSLYPICLHDLIKDASGGKTSPFFKLESRDEIDSIFNYKSSCYQRNWASSHLQARHSNASSTTSSVRYKRKRSSCSSFHPASPSSDSDNDFTEKEGESPPVIASTLRIHLNPMDFDYFTSVVRSDDETERTKSRRKRVDPGAFYTEQTRAAADAELSVNQLCQLLIDLIRKLCISEPSDSSNQTSVQSISFALEQLCTLQFGALTLGAVELDLELKCCLTRLLLTAMARVVSSHDATSTVIHNGTVPLLVRVLEDAVRKISGDAEKQDEGALEFIYGCIHALLCFLYFIIHQPDRSKDFVEVFRSVSESHGGRLLENVISLLLNSEIQKNTGRAKKLISLVGMLVASLKRVRSDIVHSFLCKRPRHRQCGFIESHHHHDLLGQTYNPISSSCCITTLFMVLTRLAQSCGNFDVEMRTLKVMNQCGSCCCQPPRVLLLPMLELVSRNNFKLSSMALSLLEKVLYGELGSSAGISSSCSICGSKMLQLLLSPSGFSTDDSSTSTLHESNITLLEEGSKNNWACLEAYRDLLESQDLQICFIIIEHLFKVTPAASSVVKRELLFKVFFPTFLGQKEKITEDPEDEVAQFLVTCCLSVFSSQLCNISSAEEFINRGGLNYILELITVPEYSKLCCAILEVTIIIELWRTTTEQAEGAVALKSLDMLIDALESTAPVLIGYLQKIALKQLRRERLGLASIGSDSGCPTENTDSSEQQGDEQPTPNRKQFLQQLNLAAIFWKSCASLTACSPEFRYHLSNHNLASQARKLLQLVVHQAVRGPSDEDDYHKGSEFYLIMRLLESLITIGIGTSTPNIDANSDASEGAVEQSVLDCVKEAVLALKPRGRTHVRAMCDMLLRCAATHFFDQQVLPARSKPELPTLPPILNDVTPPPFQKADSEEADVSSYDNSYLTADEGYEADAEVAEHLSDATENTAMQFDSQFSLNPVFPQHNFKHSAFSKPELCCLVVTLLVQLNENSEGEFNSSLVHALQKLATLCRDSPQNCVTLTNHGVIKSLLTGFSKCLQVKDTEHTELQKVIIDLVSLLARYSITPKELTLYLSFFKSKNPPCDILLPPFANLAAQTRPQPHFILCFPVESNCNAHEMPAMVKDAERLSLDMHSRHSKTSTNSAWANAAVALPLNMSLGWSMWTQGFSASLWLRSEFGGTEIPTVSASPRNSNASCASGSVISDWTHLMAAGPASSRSSLTDSMKSAQAIQNLMHIFSLGGESLTLECWADSVSEVVCLRLCRSDNNYEVLAETMIDHFLPKGNWHHLAVNVKDFIQQKKTIVEVTLILDGWKEATVHLKFTGLLVRKCRPACFLLGNISTGFARQSGRWYFGGMMMFRSAVFNRERAMYLAGLGPNFTNLTECEVNKLKPNFSQLFTQKTVNCGINWDTVLEGTNGNLKALQDNLLLIYSAQSCQVVQIYPVVVTNPAGTVGSLFPPSSVGFRVVASEQRASQQVPLTTYPVFLMSPNKRLEPQQFSGLVAAASLIGGIQVFLVLLARVVELGCAEPEQAQAVTLLLKLAQGDAELFCQLAEHQKLLLQVLEAPQCKAGPHVLKAFLDACTDRSLMPSQLPVNDVTVSHMSDAIVVNSFLLVTTLKAWRAWDSPALSCLFRALHALLRDDHPQREFNAFQMNRMRLVETLLMFCKDKFLYEEQDEGHMQMPPDVSCSLVELVRSLMGAPPEFSHIVAVADFLLLVHRASATYVSHARANFYFLLVNDDFNKQFSYLNLESERKKSRGDIYQPVDPSKLNKALANLQIKQNDLDSDADLDSNRVEEEQEQRREGRGSMEEIMFGNGSSLSFFPGMDDEDEQISALKKNKSNWEKFNAEAGLKDEEGEGEKANCQFIVVEGLLLLLRDTILVLPDSMSQQVLNHVIRPDMLLAMANHTDYRVRTAVVRVLSAYLQRAADEEINKFLKMKGFYLLANQLSQYEATVELVESCISLVTRCQMSVEEQTELCSLKDLTAIQLASFPPLLSLLPRSVCDTALCHNVIFFLREVITKVPTSYKSVLDCGLLEALGNTLLAVSHLPPDHSDLCGVSEQDLIIGDIFVFFVTIMGRAIGQPGSQNLQIILDSLLQIGYLEGQERKRCGWPSRCTQILRDAQSAILEGALERLQERGSSASTQNIGKPKTSASLLATMLSVSNDDLPIAFSSVSAQQFLTLSGQLKDVPRGEINERFKILIQKSVEFLTSVEPLNGVCRVSESENGFARSLLVLLVRALGSTLEKQPRPAARTAWQGAVWTARDTIRLLLGQLVGFMMSPRQPVIVRMFAVVTLQGEPKSKEILGTLLQSNAQVEHRFSVFLRDLLMPHRGLSLSTMDTKICEMMIAKLTSWGIISVKNVPSDPVLWSEELALLHEEPDRLRISGLKQCEIAQRRAVFKLEELAKLVAESAMVATRAAVEAQNAERKAFMEHIKAATSESVQLRATWHRIVQQLTHEKAVWFFPDSYPRSWQLDPTEGPSRVRKRLLRCNLKIKDRYLLPDYRHKSETNQGPEPLSFLYELDGRGSSSVLIERLHTNEKIRYMTPVQVVTPAQEVLGEILVGETCLYFVSDDIDATFEASSMAWHFEDVREIHQRRFQLQERAVEIFLANGRTFLLALQSYKQRDEFLQVVSQCTLPNLQSTENLSSVMQMWRDGLLSNFEYLIQLNKMAGRSFNDLMQYPVFPFVLADYTSPRLDLSSTSIYRNFEKPMAVQDKRNEQHYIDTYNYLKQELQGGLSTISLNHEPFHYGSHYSNSGTILHFLVRMPPFTRMFLSYQDNNFDIPDRTFHALHTTWRLTSSDSTTDVKELIPEFFFLPEFLLNAEGFSLGVRQNGEKVHHVELPPWCDGDPRHFILANRQALESDYVRENLPHWIDLVFGFKQTGKAAVDAINVFHPATYIGFDVTTIKDPLERVAWETMVRTYGQTPRQLFKAPHPMIVQSLASKEQKRQAGPVAAPFEGTIQNLRWGSYVGSPSEGEPKVAWKHTHRTPVAGLVPMRSNDVFGLAPCTSLLLTHQGSRGSLLGTPNVLGAALVSWGHPDGVVRAKMRKEQPPAPLLQAPSLDPVVLCASTPDLPQLWIALASGRILVLRLSLQPTKGQLEPKRPPVQLLGHEGPVTALSLCTAFSVAVSASQDGAAIIWDLNTLAYVRSIVSAGGPVQKVAISDTSGDIALAGPTADGSAGSLLQLYTVNATFIKSITCDEQITALCFSCAPEGLAVNCVAAGLVTGEIRLWNSWDLTPVRKISCEYINSPIISLAYSIDAQHLYASAMDGTVAIWEASGTKGKTAKFLNLTSL